MSTIVNTWSLPRRELIMNEVHRPRLVDLALFGPPLAQLGSDPMFWRFVT
jgi:hypothetical protein